MSVTTALYSALYLCVIVTSIRVWVSWYDLKAGKSQLQRAWHKVINLNSEVEDLYFKDSQTYGNPYSQRNKKVSVGCHSQLA